MKKIFFVLLSVSFFVVRGSDPESYPSGDLLNKLGRQASDRAKAWTAVNATVASKRLTALEHAVHSLEEENKRLQERADVQQQLIERLQGNLSLHKRTLFKAVQDAKTSVLQLLTQRMAIINTRMEGIGAQLKSLRRDCANGSITMSAQAKKKSSKTGRKTK